jgi:hypothetical protein
VVCFRLKKDELSLLREILPSSVTQSAGSVHKLARAAILDRIENSNAIEPQGSGCSRAGVTESPGSGNVPPTKQSRPDVNA